jgi:hypothetical protein
MRERGVAFYIGYGRFLFPFPSFFFFHPSSSSSSHPSIHRKKKGEGRQLVAEVGGWGRRSFNTHIHRNSFPRQPLEGVCSTLLFQVGSFSRGFFSSSSS